MVSCLCDDNPAWWYAPAEREEKLATRRSRRCCSCRKLLRPGETVLRFIRWRAPRDWVEEAIYGEDGEIRLADWYMCEECAGLYWALEERGFCHIDIENIREEARDASERDRDIQKQKMMQAEYDRRRREHDAMLAERVRLPYDVARCNGVGSRGICPVRGKCRRYLARNNVEPDAYRVVWTEAAWDGEKCDMFMDVE